MTDLSLTILPETAGRCACDRAAATNAPSGPAVCQARLADPRGGRAHPRSVVHRAHRHVAGRLGADVAGPDRRRAGAAARAVDGRAAVPRPRHRPGADRARAEGGEGARATAGLLVGDEPYYGKVGFKRVPKGKSDAGTGRSGAGSHRGTCPGRLRGRQRSDPAGLGQNCFLPGSRARREGRPRPIPTHQRVTHMKRSLMLTIAATLWGHVPAQAQKQQFDLSSDHVQAVLRIQQGQPVADADVARRLLQRG